MVCASCGVLQLCGLIQLCVVIVFVCARGVVNREQQ